MRWSRAVAVALLLASGVAACSENSSSSLPTPSKAFCQAAYDYDTNLPKLVGKIEKQTDLVEKLAKTAPKDIAADARVYLDAMKRRAAGDTSVIDNPKIERAVDNVNRRATAGCKLFQQNQDGTGGI
jgi:ABC-type oligopeptide transport system substrate-binding subunit